MTLLILALLLYISVNNLKFQVEQHNKYSMCFMRDENFKPINNLIIEETN